MVWMAGCACFDCFCLCEITHTSKLHVVQDMAKGLPHAGSVHSFEQTHEGGSAQLPAAGAASAVPPIAPLRTGSSAAGTSTTPQAGMQSQMPWLFGQAQGNAMPQSLLWAQPRGVLSAMNASLPSGLMPPMQNGAGAPCAPQHTLPAMPGQPPMPFMPGVAMPGAFNGPLAGVAPASAPTAAAPAEQPTASGQTK